MVSIRRAKQGFQLRRRGGALYGQLDKEKIGLIAAGLCIGFLVVFLYSIIGSDVDGNNGQRRAGLPESLRKTKQHPVLSEVEEVEESNNGSGRDSNNNKTKKIAPMGDMFNSFALDIVETLDCKTLLEDAAKKLKSNNSFYNNNDFDNNGDRDVGDVGRRRRRRLNAIAQQHGDDGGFGFGDMNNNNNKEEEGKDIDNFGGDDSIPVDNFGDGIDNENIEGGNGKNMYDDITGFGDGGYNFLQLSAKHLFCIAASENPPEEVANEIKCDAGKKKRRTILELWSAARSQMEKSLLVKVLDLAQEQTEEILGVSYNIWAPQNDDGLRFMVNTLNSDNDVDDGGINGLTESLGKGKLFVDVGSCLGMTCLAVNTKYPGTKIVSLEPAAPSWLLQEINLRCNLSKTEFKNIHIILAGVGPNTDDEDNMMANMMWRPTSTTSTRSWTPSEEFKPDDVEIIVRLRQLKSILAEANVITQSPDVLNLDCQGCEYNVIPALSEEEYERIPTVMGGVHWGYIKPNKLPSSARGRTTHQRLCSHENIAKRTKECCAFPDLPVKSSVPGEILQKADDTKGGFPPGESTVSDIIADGLCDNFPEWAKEHYLNDVIDDFNWFELSSQA